MAELEEATLEQCEATFDSEYRRSQLHDSLLDICVSAFGPESEIGRHLGYGFLSSEPLKERGLKGFDCLIYNPALKSAIFVECKSSVSSPSTTLSDVDEAIRVAVRENDYLEGQIGDRISGAEFALCLPAESVQPVIRTLREREAAGQASDVKVLLWQVNRFVGQTVQLVPLEFRPPPEGQHKDRNLTRVLAAGVRVDEAEVLSKVYPSSHPLRVAKEILTELLYRNMSVGTCLQDIRKSDVLAFLSDPTNLVHYARPAIAGDLYRRFEQEGIGFGLLRGPDEQGHLEVTVEGKTPKTVLRGFEREFRAKATATLARRRAREEAIREFRQKQSTLQEY